KALGWSVLLLTAWAYLPVFCLTLLPTFLPGSSRFVAPVAVWMSDSSPMGPLLNFSGVMPRGTFVEQVARMIALQAAGGLVPRAWTGRRLRAICRKVEDHEGRARLLRRALARPRRRPPCGDDPVLWYEMYAARGVSEGQRRVGLVIHLLLVAAVLSGLGLY